MKTNITRFVWAQTVFAVVWTAVQSAQAQYFTNIGAMNTAREMHATALLLDGRVLVAGGINKTGWVSGVEIYDPATGVWATTNSLSLGRHAAKATLLPNGKVLVTGGYNYYAGGPVATVDLYDPASGTWSTNTMSTPRTGATATPLGNGQVLVTGGAYDNNSHHTNSTELYNPTNATWTLAAPMSIARVSHTATLLTDGQVLVAGGYYYSAGQQILSTAELYNPTNGTWTPVNPIANARYAHTATRLANGKVLIAGGQGTSDIIASAEMYDPASRSWTPVRPMTGARYYHTATLLPNNQLLVAGGYPSLASAELFDPDTATWAPAGTLTHSRYLHSATLLPNGRALLVGGDDNTGSYNAVNSAEQYIPAPVVVPPPHFSTTSSNLRFATDGFHLQVDQVIATNSLVIYASTNLSNWLPIFTNGPATGSISIVDTTATNSPMRFYRAAER
jgi:WD40 repeat protein